MIKPNYHALLDPPIFSCFSTSYPSIVFNRLKWSTVSTSVALLIIIFYATSGLSTLIDVKTLSSIESLEGRNVTIQLMNDFAVMSIHLRWISVCIYFSVVLFVIPLICGIQFAQPWFIFIWSIIMIIMLLLDGIITVLSIRHDDQQIHRPSQQSRILSTLLTIRLSISLFGIFLSIFHFRALSRAKLEFADRQRMLNRYNTESTSISNKSSWPERGTQLLPGKESRNEDQQSTKPGSILFPPLVKLATIQRRPVSTLFNARHFQQSKIDSTNSFDQQTRSELNPAFQYNLPFEERNDQQKNIDEQQV